MIRRAAVAGSFYPGEPDELRRALEDSYTHPIGPGTLPPAKYVSKGVVSCVCPHAGYAYSGPVAAHSYLHISSLRKPQVVAIVAPNHYGVGSGISTFRDGDWETPLGRVPVDREAASEMVKLTGIVDYDPSSQRMEHSLEVQLPFLQQIYGRFSLLPLCIAFQEVETARELGKGLAELLRGKDAVLIASSDLTHYEPAQDAKRKDLALLERVTSLDLTGFYSVLQNLNVTACGFGRLRP